MVFDWPPNKYMLLSLYIDSKYYGKRLKETTKLLLYNYYSIQSQSNKWSYTYFELHFMFYLETGFIFLLPSRVKSYNWKFYLNRFNFNEIQITEKKKYETCLKHSLLLKSRVGNVHFFYIEIFLNFSFILSHMIFSVCVLIFCAVLFVVATNYFSNRYVFNHLYF